MIPSSLGNFDDSKEDFSQLEVTSCLGVWRFWAKSPKMRLNIKTLSLEETDDLKCQMTKDPLGPVALPSQCNEII